MAEVAVKPTGGLIGIIADEDTVTGFLLCGVGNVDARKKTNYLVVDSKTTTKQIEATFKEFTGREDIGMILIGQTVANSIRSAVEQFQKPSPAILEIPSKDCPYDPSVDSILSRVQFMLGST